MLQEFQKGKKLIGEFARLYAFIEAIVNLKMICCCKEKYSNGETVLKSNWAEFLNSLGNRLNEQDTPHKLSLFIKIAQNNLTEFVDDLYNHYQDCEPCTDNCRLEVRNLLQEISTETTELLDSLHTNYKEFFDLNARIPLWVIYNNKKAIPKQKQIINGLEKKKVNPELIQILGDYLDYLYTPDYSRNDNWRQFFYLQNLADRLISFTELTDTDDDTMKLIKILIGVDFNPLAFYEFMLDYSTGIVGTDMPYEDQEMELLVLLKTVENIRQESKVGYNTEVPTILESVRNFILRELVTVSKMKEVLMPYPVNGSNGRNSSYYFDVSATLEELFFMMRVMLEVRFIKTKFKANLYSFVSKHIRTDRTKSPSEQYMRNIFGPNREVPIRVVRKVRAWLMNMVNYIDRHFGNHLKLWFLSFLTYYFTIEQIFALY